VKRVILLLPCFFLLSVLPVLLAAEILEFSDSVQEERFLKLTEELRCLVCQNENLADSNAGLAKDLKKEIHGMIQNGDSNEVIIDYLVARYGDFILFRPPFKATTYFLWLGPFIFLLIGVFFARSLFRQQKVQNLTGEEHQYASRLLEDIEENRKN
jgi:cytochrome c-type biogenesis protein CcmH